MTPLCLAAKHGMDALVDVSYYGSDLCKGGGERAIVLGNFMEPNLKKSVLEDATCKGN